MGSPHAFDRFGQLVRHRSIGPRRRFQFPLWWHGMPAILKGWIDRVFASGGHIYGGGKWYDRGVFTGKRAMCSVTIGGGAPMYSENGLNGPITSTLFAINHGVLYFTGFAVVEPFLVHA